MLTTAIGIDARLETDIRAVVMRDDRAGEIAVVDGLAARPLGIVFFLGIGLEMERFEAIGGVEASAAAMDRTRHVSRSYERMQCPAGLDSRACKASFPLAPFRFLRPGVAQGDGAIEYE